jgi:hypothetical protein
MAGFTGTYDISSLLAARFQSVAEFGMDTIAQVLANELAAHNANTEMMLSGLVDFTTDRQRKYGTAVNANDMMEVDEYGRAPTRRVKPGATVGFPLKLFQYPVGWTEKWMQTHTPADMAQLVIGAQMSHTRRIQLELQRAVFRATNYTFNDHLVDNVDLSVKRLLNADGDDIPAGPFGEVFDGSSETHYFGATAAWSGATAAQKATDLNNLITQLLEKGHGGQVVILINRAQEADVTALTATTPAYTGYRDDRIRYVASDNTVVAEDRTRLDNRAIGIFGAAEVQVRPWIPAGYVMATDLASESPLAMRQRASTGLQGLRIAAEHSTFPLTAQFMEAEFGVGVWTRTNGVCLDTTDTSYADPTL